MTDAIVPPAPPEPSATPVSDLQVAADAFVDLVALVPDDVWERPALGVWTVRDLVGHTSRALSTLVEYLGAAPVDRVVHADALAYFTAAARSGAGAAGAGAAGAGAAEAVAERGRAAGRALGPDPHRAVAALAERALATVAAASEDAVLPVPLGAMRLRDYLPTRTFELTVHSLDLHAVLAVPWTAPPGPLRACAHLATDLALVRGQGQDLLLALTGRRPLSAGLGL